ncbi:hypothetical protein ACN94_22040, partial [Gordonia paraffinivorans]|nr:hypothetical protein [Gordonia paraffinivorans]
MRVSGRARIAVMYDDQPMCDLLVLVGPDLHDDVARCAAAAGYRVLSDAERSLHRGSQRAFCRPQPSSDRRCASPGGRGSPSCTTTSRCVISSSSSARTCMTTS